MDFKGITILSDMDGTLLDSKKNISKNNLAKIKYFKENGGTFTIASGRTYKKITMYANELGTDVPVIASNGAVIYDFSLDKVLYKKTMDRKCLKFLEEIHNRFPQTGIEVGGVECVEFLYPSDMVTKHIIDEDFASDFPNGEIVWKKPNEVTADITKIMFCDYPENIDTLSKTLPLLYGDYTFFKSDTIYYEMVEPGTNKGLAVPKLKDILKDRAKKVYAVGDNMNDVEMLNNSDVGVCVRNANEKVKEQADFILPFTNDEDAIAKLIDMIAKGVI